ncbi:TolC family protein [Rhodopirellula sp. MGV]|uniref:TolC family protein n=1 Tax=Rhodopirellula sp. MGV TaxID=2023130 RepID=UPI00130460CF|nr:TolC family protein [Rhodopirellula sp. MGV]
MPNLSGRSVTLFIGTVIAVAMPGTLRAQRPSWDGLPSLHSPAEPNQFTGVDENTPDFPPEPPSASDTPPASLIEKDSLRWWSNSLADQLTERDRWVKFDIETVLLDALANSPRIKSVSYQASSTFQQIIQQDAEFDPTILLSSDLGATNDPVGNTLTTGGADRLRERSLNFKGGGRKLTRRGTEVEWTQQLGFLDSNSSFFVPTDQGNARLSLGLTKPLLSRGKQFYNERLITQARIESQASWHEMRGAVEQRIADVISAYWKLYEIRAQVAQQRALMNRSESLVKILNSRKDFDAARIEIVKARQRMARRNDQLIEFEAELSRLQSRLSTLVGSQALSGTDRDLELIPVSLPEFSDETWSLRDAMAQALEYRPEIRAAMNDVELSALELRISKVELQPQLNWVFNGYLSQLNGSSRVARSFGEQFANAPGISTALEFELPQGRRSARASQREALLRSKQRTEKLREVIQQTQFEVETALIDIARFSKQRRIKIDVLEMAIDEETILTVNWQLIGGDDSRVGIKLENLLDAQQRRADAEKDLVASESAYMTALMRLQRAMGTLLVNEGVHPHQSHCTGDIEFLTDSVALPSAPIQTEALVEPTAIEVEAPVQTLESQPDFVPAEIDPLSLDAATAEPSQPQSETPLDSGPSFPRRLPQPDQELVPRRLPAPTKQVEESLKGSSAAQGPMLLPKVARTPSGNTSSASALQMPSYPAAGNSIPVGTLTNPNTRQTSLGGWR